jgi:hypothetical protein
MMSSSLFGQLDVVEQRVAGAADLVLDEATDAGQ